MRKFGAALVIGVLLAAGAACGGGGSERPSVNDVSTALTEGGEDSLLGSVADKIDDKAADCIAKALVDSRISDKALRALVAGDTDYKPSPADEKAIGPVTSKMMACLATSVPTDGATG